MNLTLTEHRGYILVHAAGRPEVRRLVGKNCQHCASAKWRRRLPMRAARLCFNIYFIYYECRL